MCAHFIEPRPWYYHVFTIAEYLKISDILFINIISFVTQDEEEEIIQEVNMLRKVGRSSVDLQYC